MLISKFPTENMIDKIEEFQKKLNINIPEDYKMFLSKYNGGETYKTAYKCKNKIYDIRVFFGIGDVKYSFDNISVMKIEGNEYLPIACDFYGNYFLMSLEKDNDKIVFFDHEEGNSITDLANTFREFIQMCDSEILDKKSIKSVEEREKDLISRGKGANITDALRKAWQDEIDKYSNINQVKVEL